MKMMKPPMPQKGMQAKPTPKAAPMKAKAPKGKMADTMHPQNPAQFHKLGDD